MFLNESTIKRREETRTKIQRHHLWLNVHVWTASKLIWRSEMFTYAGSEIMKNFPLYESKREKSISDEKKGRSWRRSFYAFSCRDKRWKYKSHTVSTYWCDANKSNEFVFLSCWCVEHESSDRVIAGIMRFVHDFICQWHISVSRDIFVYPKMREMTYSRTQKPIKK